MKKQLILDLHGEMIVDNFAGGGGASTGIELALGRCTDIAINHDAQAVAMHQANHPQTVHLREDVFAVDPVAVTNGRPVGLAWFSPDCKHFSKAKGGKPRSKKIRGLAWVMVKWAATVRPRVCVLENVEEFKTWGPLLDDGRPCPQRKGKTFKSFIKRLMNLGYAVEWRELRACDYGAPTIRRRLFLIARCDGKPIVWPAPTHCDPSKRLRGLKPWRTAAECINWGLPCPSIFLTTEEARRMRVKRPLAAATERRIARGMFKFVIDAKEPFIVPLTHQGGDRVEAVTSPMRTVTGAHRGERALVTPFLTECANGSHQRTFSAEAPLRTQCAEVKGGHFALVSAFLAKHYGGVVGSKLKAAIGTITAVDHHSLVAAHMVRHFGQSVGSDPVRPLPTTTAGGGGKTALVTSHLMKFYGTTTGQDARGPIHTITGSCAGGHHAEVRAFLIKYYGNEKDGHSVAAPLGTITCLDRMGLVTVAGQDYVIDDIGMRMLKPRELFAGQGFPPDYVIAPMVNGKSLSEEAQVRMCGNSVPPPVALAIVAANVPELRISKAA